MAKSDLQLLAAAETGISAHLAAERDSGRITGTYYDDAISQTIPNLQKWLLAGELDQTSPNLRDGLRAAIQDLRWEALTNAYSREVAFGTGGIREKMGSRRDEVLRLKNEGIHAPIIKGPNTINDVVLLLTSAGVARFGCARKPPLRSIVIGFDSRVRGGDFARLIASLFLAYGFTVYLFDEACMYPSVTFAVPTLKADIGVFVSASHNDFRYNGYKLSCWNGSQFDPAERDDLYRNYIQTTTFSDIRTISFADASPQKLWFLGGVKRSDGKRLESGEHAGMPLGDPLTDVPPDHYSGREGRIIDLHTLHMNHVKQFILRGEMIASAGNRLSIGYSAFNGSGRKAVPRLLGEIGFRDVRQIMKLDPLDGMFPAFCSDPGKEQQPDPGDWRAADIAVEAFKEEYPAFWDQVDLLVGTDPDADRCGVIVKVPRNQRSAYLHRGTVASEPLAPLSSSSPLEEGSVATEAPSSSAAVAAAAPPKSAVGSGSLGTSSAGKSDLGAEVRLLDDARRSLNSNPRETIRKLDEYGRTFKGGQLQSEATMLRIQALLSAGDRAAAEALGAQFLDRASGPLAARVRAILGKGAGEKPQ